MYGDICYIKVKPLDGDIFYLTASTEGYYVNKVGTVEPSVYMYNIPSSYVIDVHM